jgi:hypothetical protein
VANGHNNVRRLVHRSGEELRATKELASVVGWRDAANTFRAKLDIQVMNRNGFKEPPAVRSRLLRKHESVIEYLESRFGDFYASYDYGKELPVSDPASEGKIWMCWWQGLENAPEIVRACVESVHRNAGNRGVVVITDKNMADYVDIPGWIFDKVADGTITRTNLSDLLRLSLLAEHGGLWLDATFFCTGPLEDMCFGRPFWSIKRPDYLHASIASGYFAGYSLACDAAHRRPFLVTRDFFLEYWKKSAFMVDYLLVDYLIVLAQRHCPEVAADFRSIEPNNRQCDELVKVLGEPFDQECWNELRKDTALFKLTWKQGFPQELNGRETFYSALLKGKI